MKAKLISLYKDNDVVLSDFFFNGGQTETKESIHEMPDGSRITLCFHESPEWICGEEHEEDRYDDFDFN